MLDLLTNMFNVLIDMFEVLTNVLDMLVYMPACVGVSVWAF
jgi:hypothetical protein